MSLPVGATDVQRVAGGDINEAFKVRLRDGRRAFVKTRSDPAPGEYAAEAAALAWLADACAAAGTGASAVRTPRVLEVDERYLALQWITPGSLDAQGEEELGRGLATMHHAGASSFGADTVARFGSLTVSNEALDDWPTFYARRRLLPLARLAREQDALSAAGAGAVQRVCERLVELCGPPEPPARLHGDLWQGNVLADERGRPWLIDPSAYGGHREVDLAMLALFGSVPERMLAAYRERFPLADGWRERVALYQLLPLLVHALLFGGHYGAAVERAALRYVG